MKFKKGNLISLKLISFEEPDPLILEPMMKLHHVIDGKPDTSNTVRYHHDDPPMMYLGTFCFNNQEKDETDFRKKVWHLALHGGSIYTFVIPNEYTDIQTGQRGYKRTRHHYLDDIFKLAHDHPKQN